MYLESVKDTKTVYKRKGVISEVILDDGIFDCDNVVLGIDAENKRFYVEKSDEESNHVCMLNKIGVLSGITGGFDIMLIDGQNFIAMPTSGVVFIAGDFGTGEETVAPIEVTERIPARCYLEDIKWYTARDFYDLILSAKGEGKWGVVSYLRPYDYIYSLQAAYKEDKEGWFTIKVIDTIDISLGKNEALHNRMLDDIRSKKLHEQVERCRRFRDGAEIKKRKEEEAEILSFFE